MAPSVINWAPVPYAIDFAKTFFVAISTPFLAACVTAVPIVAFATNGPIKLVGSNIPLDMLDIKPST